MTKQTRTKIPEGAKRVRNAVTGKTKVWCAMCGEWGDHGNAKHLKTK